MPAGATYDCIATYTTTGSLASYTFSSIPQTYTDLKLIVSSRGTSFGNQTNIRVRFNGDTGSTYHAVRGQSYGSGTGNNFDPVGDNGIYFNTNGQGYDTNILGTFTLDIQSYATTATRRAMVGLEFCSLNGIGTTSHYGYCWTQTNAITSITLAPDTASFAIGSRFNLFGITAA
jgi:hypothetical protein